MLKMQGHTPCSRVAIVLVASLGCFATAGAHTNSAETEDPFHGGFADGEYATGIQLPAAVTTHFAQDGKELVGGLPPRALVLDPTLRTRLPESVQPENTAITQKSFATTTSFRFSYYSAGSSDPWSEPCFTIPDPAKSAIEAAGAIWANSIKSTVPIDVQICWANLGSSSILGYAGGSRLFRNFSGAPLSNVWYVSSLANALSGVDRNPGTPDMYITFNTGFSWYFGLDGNPPFNQMDLVSIALHEIGHGLNFAGSMSYSGGQGSWGYGSGYPNIYDTFAEDGAGNSLILSYTNPSNALGSALTSNNLWFNGVNANAANGGNRVKLYAPSTWAGGSSYAHLDYNTFNNTINQLMVYAFSYGEVAHEPGPITLGMLQDMGWSLNAEPSCPFSNDLTLQNTTLNSLESQSACQTITLGPSYTITPAGSLSLTAGQSVTLKPGVSIQSGGHLSIRIQQP